MVKVVIKVDIKCAVYSRLMLLCLFLPNSQECGLAKHLLIFCFKQYKTKHLVWWPQEGFYSTQNATTFSYLSSMWGWTWCFFSKAPGIRGNPIKSLSRTNKWNNKSLLVQTFYIISKNTVITQGGIRAKQQILSKKWAHKV